MLKQEHSISRTARFEFWMWQWDCSPRPPKQFPKWLFAQDFGPVNRDLGGGGEAICFRIVFQWQEQMTAVQTGGGPEKCSCLVDLAPACSLKPCVYWRLTCSLQRQGHGNCRYKWHESKESQGKSACILPHHVPFRTVSHLWTLQLSLFSLHLHSTSLW